MNYLLAGIVLGFFTSCAGTRSPKTNNHEQEIFTLIFHDMVEPDSSWRNEAKDLTYFYFSPKLSLTDDQVEFDSLSLLMDIRMKYFDTVTVQVFITDSIHPVPNFVAGMINNMLKDSTEWFNNYHGFSYTGMLSKMANSKVTYNFELSLIRSNYNYSIVEYDIISNLETINEDKVGFLDFSTLVFNEDKTKACIYSDLVKAPLNAFGMLYLLDYKHGKWKIIYKNMLWIS